MKSLKAQYIATAFYRHFNIYSKRVNDLHICVRIPSYSHFDLLLKGEDFI